MIPGPSDSARDPVTLAAPMLGLAASSALEVGIGPGNAPGQELTELEANIRLLNHLRIPGRLRVMPHQAPGSPARLRTFLPEPARNQLLADLRRCGYDVQAEAATNPASHGYAYRLHWEPGRTSAAAVLEVVGHVELLNDVEAELHLDAHGPVRLGNSSRLIGSVRTRADLALGESARVAGDALCSGPLHLGTGAVVGGDAAAAMVALGPRATIRGVTSRHAAPQAAAGERAAASGEPLIQLVERSQSATAPTLPHPPERQSIAPERGSVSIPREIVAPGETVRLVGEPPSFHGPYSFQAILRPRERDGISLFFRDLQRTSGEAIVRVRIHEVVEGRVRTTFAAGTDGPAGEVRFSRKDAEGGPLLDTLLPRLPEFEAVELQYVPAAVCLGLVTKRREDLDGLVRDLVALESGAALEQLEIRPAGPSRHRTG